MKLLIVDDDIPTVELLRNSIRWDVLKIGQIYTAYNISMAKPILENKLVEIVICDIEMPMGSGLDLLIWARENQLKCEFIFLTCHESFEFASTAIKYQANSYVLKPFRPDRITEEVIKAIEKVDRENRLEEYSRYGSYWMENKASVEREFWRELLFGNIVPNQGVIRHEIEKRNIPLCAEDPVHMVLTSIPITEEITEKWGDANEGLFEYSVGKLCTEVFLEESEASPVITYRRGSILWAVYVVQSGDDLYYRCRKLVMECKNIFKCDAACYISENVPLEKAASVLSAMEETDRNNLSSRGKVFRWDPEFTFMQNGEVIDVSDLPALLLKGDKLQILNAMRRKLETLEAAQKLTSIALHQIQQNIIQEVYVYLYNNGIQPNLLFDDATSYQLMQDATASLYNMMKWISYFFNRVMDYDNKLQESRSIIEQAKSYIHLHYSEDINRNEVAKSVYLTPEYLAKIFKKETGVSINNYINQYRVDQAKQLMKSSRAGISEIAARVGYNNASYFVTIFRKLTGLTPSDYRQALSGE